MNRQTEIDELLGSIDTGHEIQAPTGAFPSVTRATLAKALGLTTRAVNELVTNGVAVKTGRGEYDMIASVANYIEKLRKPDGSAKDRLTTAQADLAELKLAAESHKLLDSMQVQSTWEATLRELRAAMLAIPNRIQSELGNLSAHDIAAIDRNIRETLTELGTHHGND